MEEWTLFPLEGGVGEFPYKQYMAGWRWEKTKSQVLNLLPFKSFAILLRGVCFTRFIT